MIKFLSNLFKNRSKIVNPLKDQSHFTDIPNKKEIKCVAFAYNILNPDSGFSLEEVEIEIEKNLEDWKTCSKKYFTQLWGDYGLKNYGAGYTFRGIISNSDKEKCIKYWVKILFGESLDLEKMLDIERKKIKKEYDEYKKENPNGHISFSDPIDLIPKAINFKFADYKRTRKSQMIDTFRNIDNKENKNDAEEIISAIVLRIENMSSSYKELTNDGKFEALLLFSIFSIQTYGLNYPNKKETFISDYFPLIEKCALDYGINMDDLELTNFVNVRFQMFAKEIDKLNSYENYTIGKIFSSLYKNPLKIDISPNMDLTEHLNIMDVFSELCEFLNYRISKL